MWMWLRVERGNYLGSRSRVEMRKFGRNIAAVNMTVNQKAQEAVETVDLCCDACELFRIAEQTAGEKRDVVGVTYFKYGSGTLKLSVDDRKKNLERAFRKVDEC